MEQDDYELIEDVSNSKGIFLSILEFALTIIFVLIGIYIGFNLINVSIIAIAIGGALIYLSYRK